MCAKAAYVTRRDARAAARWMARRGSRATHAYLCPRCGLWHLSSMGRGLGRRAAKEKERREHV